MKLTAIQIKSAKKMLLPLFLFLLAIIFWNSTFLLPVKYLTVFFHELSHGIAAILTGGKIVKIVVNANEGGYCITAGGNISIILSAGYLGSLLFGGTILLLASKTNKDKLIIRFLGLLLILVTILWVRNLFGAAICTVSAIALFLLAKYATDNTCDVFLRFFGLTSCFYVITDIKSDLIDRSVPESDAYRLAQLWHLPDWLVGFIWLVFALYITYKILSYCLNIK